MDENGKKAFETLSRLEDCRAFDYYANLGKVRAYVRENFKQPISLGDAAKVASLERRYFSTYFHQRVGIGFHDWVTAVRVHRAVRLIEERDAPLGWICDEAGFGNPRTFQRAFKKWTGQTAREFRALIRQETVQGAEQPSPAPSRKRRSPYVASPRVSLNPSRPGSPGSGYLG